MEKPKPHFLSFIALWWCALGLLGVTLLAFRIVKTSNLSESFRVEDVPLLDFVDLNYATGLWVLAALALMGLGVGVWIYRHEGLNRRWRHLTGMLQIMAGIGLTVRALPLEGAFERPNLTPTGFFDWLVIGIYVSASLGMFFILPTAEIAPRPAPAKRKIPRAALIYLLATATLMVGAVFEHLAFWDDYTKTANYAWKPIAFFFGGEEHVFEANLLIYTTSLLFVSLTSVICVVGYIVFRKFVTRPAQVDGLGERQMRIAALMMGVAWTGVLGLPWLTKLLPEIRSEGAWLFPVAVIGVILGSFSAIFYSALLSLRADLNQDQSEGAELRWRASDLAYVAFAASAAYPFLRLVIPKRPRWRLLSSVVVGAIFMVGLAITTAYVTDWFDFDDWRDMLKRAQFPVMRVAFTLGAVWAGYTLIGMISRFFTKAAAEAGEEVKPKKLGAWLRWGLTLAALAVGLASSFPFWGQSEISENTHARAIEFNDRHGFEIQFLNSIFDFDRDGYASLLHGSDPDDFDANVQGFGFPPLVRVDLTPPVVEVVDPEKAKAFPNLVLIYLEGIPPSSINFYGDRHLKDQDLLLPEGWKRDDLVQLDATRRSPTPFMDDIGLRGTAFSHCRTLYPSTWDGWMQTQSGHHMMISEFSAALLGRDLYSRYNVIDKLCREVGISRFCYANSSPYTNLFISTKHQEDDFDHDFDSDQTKEDKEEGIWKGDKQTERIVRFIDSLDAGERFFISEHMEDSHFPWYRSTDARVREIGDEVNYHYNGTFDWVEADARTSRHEGFLQEVTRIDSQIGHITNALKAKGLWDNTTVIVMGDHGCQWYEHQHGYYVTHLYEEAITPPLFMKVPGYQHTGIHAPQIQQVDLVPTLLELSGTRIANPEQYKLDGISLLPYLKGVATAEDDQALSRRSMIMKTHYDKTGYIHEGRYKLIADRPFGTVRLFDLLNDPKEMHNIADEQPELLANLTKKMAAMAKDKMALLIGVTPPKDRAKSSSPVTR